MDEFRQAMIKTMAGKGEVVRDKLYNSIVSFCMCYCHWLARDLLLLLLLLLLFSHKFKFLKDLPRWRFLLLLFLFATRLSCFLISTIILQLAT
jgi:hypothetical protein